MVRALLENRRWGRIFKLQSEVHGRLIDKFSSNQELAAYMETEAGKRFLEAAPIPVNIESGQRMPNAVARVLTPLQIGIVLVLLGIGLLLLRHAGPEMEIAHARLRHRRPDARYRVYHFRGDHLGVGGASWPHAPESRIVRQIRRSLRLAFVPRTGSEPEGSRNL